MTDEEAQDMLAKLEAHFHEPVLPVSKYCDALRTWAECIVKVNQKAIKENGETYEQGAEYYMHAGRISIDIRKSNLLYRLIYEGEKLRTEECPQCEGKLTFFGEPCKFGCEGTGWLHEGWQLRNLLK